MRTRRKKVIMPDHDESGAFVLRKPLMVVAREESSSSIAAVGYGMVATGDVSRSIQRDPSMPRPDGRKSKAKAIQTPEARAAGRTAWKRARDYAITLVQAIEDDDPQERFVAADVKSLQEAESRR